MEPDVYHCEQCGDRVRPGNAHTKDVRGGRGHVETLAFCPDCTDD